VAAYSSDGINWTIAGDKILGTTSIGNGEEIYSIAYGNGKFVAVGARGKIAYSTGL
jgi:hypothetical protein